mmetsp:Transcript_22472/g.42798  ORF Transcript_22472/g.42798 Transcript_22472/m.42798 type:complete len:249 (+) Transcript_22472:43-789(+)
MDCPLKVSRNCLILVALLARAPEVTSLPRGEFGEELLIGWKGEVPRPITSRLEPHDPSTDSWIEQLSWTPRAFLWHNFLTKEQCARMISLATPRMAKSKVVDSKTGGEADDPIRTSYGGVIYPQDDEELIRDIDRKAEKWTMLPSEHAEAIQVLRYADGQKYDAHWDQFDNPVAQKVCLFYPFIRICRFAHRIIEFIVHDLGEFIVSRNTYSVDIESQAEYSVHALKFVITRSMNPCLRVKRVRLGRS